MTESVVSFVIDEDLLEAAAPSVAAETLMQAALAVAPDDALHEAEALAAWEEYRQTGLHVTLAEIRPWLESWGTGRNVDLPKCHK